MRLAAIAAAGCALACHGPAVPAQPTVAPVHPTLPGRICLPDEWGTDDQGRGRIALLALADGPALCDLFHPDIAHQHDPPRCYAIDLASGRLGPAVVPDASVWRRDNADRRADAPAFVTAIDGFALPSGPQRLVRAPDGSWAVALGASVAILERGRAAPSHVIALDGAIDAVIRGDRAYVTVNDRTVTDGDGHARIAVIARDGRARPPISDDPRPVVRAIDPHRVGVADWGLRTLVIIDERGGTRTIARRVPPVRCTPAQLAAIHDDPAVLRAGAPADDDEVEPPIDPGSAAPGDGPGATVPLDPTCLADARAHLLPYVGAAPVAAGADFAVLLDGGKWGVLAILARDDLTVVSRHPVVETCR